jgi:hypothetical protein
MKSLHNSFERDKGLGVGKTCISIFDMNYLSMSILARRCCLILSFALYAPIFLIAKTMAAKNLEKGFAAPPDSAKPRVYWFWIYNDVDKAGITRDFEQFKAKGISGWGNKVSADHEATLKGTAATIVEAVKDSSRQLQKIDL